MQVIKHPLSHYTSLLKNKTPFTLARYGDGEWLTILGHYTLHNSNGCSFTKALSDDLIQVLRNQHPYEYTILNIAKRKKGAEIKAFLKREGIAIDWVSGDTMLDASLKGELFPLIEQLREYRILYVGNKRLRGLNLRHTGFFPYYAYVEPPARNAHWVKDVLLSEIKGKLKISRANLIGWSSGLAAKVFIDEVFKELPEVTQIDFGSMFDGYFKPLDHVSPLGSRSYIRRGGYDWEELRRKNTGMEK